ncbi:zinc finger, C2H2 type [Dictyocaulus viviparus]|uniref:Zinc finger, C2H2 type n=1 Tax=Dictyocaulus viviparus TaxID=29172 RepID=A0A0D8XUZ0_DICVI|nr:zinc finger, C2H2 type [Dictyocaulus viviparus]
MPISLHPWHSTNVENHSKGQMGNFMGGVQASDEFAVLLSRKLDFLFLGLLRSHSCDVGVITLTENRIEWNFIDFLNWDRTCAHCSFSGRTLECIEKHSRVHQSSSTKTSLSSNSSSSQLQLPPVVLVPMSTVPSIIPLSNSASVITVSLTTVPGEQIAVPANTALPITFATILGSTIVPSTSIDSFTQNVQQETKCPPRRSVTEPSLRFIGSDGVKRRRCLLCPYMSKFSCDMRSHMEMHTMNARFKCSQCSYSTKRAVSLRSHIALHTDDNAIRAKNSKALNIVVQKVLIGVKRGQGFTGFYTCAHCPFVTKICADLWKHARLEYMLPFERTGATTCYMLSEEFNNMMIPFRRHMGASKRFNCSLCSFSSISLDVMEQHQLLHPEGVAFIRQHPTDDEDSSSTPVPSCVELKCESSREVSNPPAEVSTSRVDAKNPITIKAEYEQAFRPTKEVLAVLKPDPQNQDKRQCPDCPFMDSDDTIFELHREMHGGRTRTFACNLCNYRTVNVDLVFVVFFCIHSPNIRLLRKISLAKQSCFAPETLHWHLSLHLPTLIPANATSQRKRGMGRRGFQTSDPIPFGAKHFACTQCSFRTVNETTFLQHRQQHAQHIQQRLVTQVKRAASQQEEDSKRCSKVKRVAKKSDKHHACMQCTFRCDTSVAFSRHLEMHTQNAIFKCRICDYSANTKNIVDFHEQNHHLGQSLTDLRKTAILAPDVVQLDVTFSSDERARLGGQDLRCRRCHFSTLDLSAYTKHWEQTHKETPEDREVAGELRMKLVPPNSILTTA